MQMIKVKSSPPNRFCILDCCFFLFRCFYSFARMRGSLCSVFVHEVQSAPAIEYASRLERRGLHNGSARVAVLERELLEID